MYVDYAFYSKWFGASLSEEEFKKAEAEAEAYIHYFTYLRGDIFAKESDCVKRAVCSAAEVIHSQKSVVSAGNGTGIKSESNDGYSVFYTVEAKDGQTAEELTRKKVFESIRMYLLPTGWLSRSVKLGGGCCGECRDNDYHL